MDQGCEKLRTFFAAAALAFCGWAESRLTEHRVTAFPVLLVFFLMTPKEPGGEIFLIQIQRRQGLVLKIDGRVDWHAELGQETG